MDTEVAGEHLTDTEDALRTLVTDLEDLVDWTTEAVAPKVPHSIRDASGKHWVALGIVGVLVGAVAVAAWRGRDR
jgi:hypothetical protein